MSSPAKMVHVIDVFGMETQLQSTISFSPVPSTSRSTEISRSELDNFQIESSSHNAAPMELAVSLYFTMCSPCEQQLENVVQKFTEIAAELHYKYGMMEQFSTDLNETLNRLSLIYHEVPKVMDMHSSNIPFLIALEEELRFNSEWNFSNIDYLVMVSKDIARIGAYVSTTFDGLSWDVTVKHPSNVQLYEQIKYKCFVAGATIEYLLAMVDVSIAVAKNIISMQANIRTIADELRFKHNFALI